MPPRSGGCHGPAEVLKTSVNQAARWLALGGNLYFGLAGLWISPW